MTAPAEQTATDYFAEGKAAYDDLAKMPATARYMALGSMLRDIDQLRMQLAAATARADAVDRGDRDAG